ncbi:hypothetical protein [Cellulomonas fengjieae]|uniref:EF-hand domain-containing protein n=1 Tax=Cellulomonas fengjieae TaxID=2819978 RepID=A0ABS3SG76_9CELL|nr:hypothetical protein [Cellulomonas fengjieae]MBO3084753.1 hypothetical protein [Cellulomonas fengjieae]QVI66927.1 hypothetical protein KG102_04895 [Cellulomonas fengjieae]
MGSEIELVSDGDGIAIIGSSTDIERFFLSAGLDRVPSKELDMHRLRSFTSNAATAGQVGADLAANSGRWVKLTAESAEAVRKYGLMATKNPGVSHAMVGQRGDIKQWLQISQAPTALLTGPFALSALSTMMQQRAMQEQMDEIVEYLQEINEKVDDILRGQKVAVLADMIGVDLIIEEALIVRGQVGRVSEVTWSKVQATGMTIARTQGYAIHQLDGIAEKLERKADLGDIAKETKKAEPKVLEWLAVLARTFQLQDAVAVLELDRVLDASPDELESHRAGLQAARQNRLALIGGCTARLLEQMRVTVDRANSKVLLNPFDAPAVVRSSNRVAIGVADFRGRLGIDSGLESSDAKRWSHAALEMRDKAVASASVSVTAAGRLGAETVGRATDVFRAVDVDGDGISDAPRAKVAADDAARAVRGAAADVIGARFKRKREHRDARAGDDAETVAREP